MQYSKKAVFSCPIDVGVHSVDGRLIAMLKDGEESDVSNDYGRFAVVRDSYSGDYIKVACLLDDDNMSFRATSRDIGLVSMEYAHAGDSAS